MPDIGASNRSNEAENAGLEARVPPYDRLVLTTVLVYHWRTNTSGCGCGWAELGKSHPEHVANVYEDSMAYVEAYWKGVPNGT